MAINWPIPEFLPECRVWTFSGGKAYSRAMQRRWIEDEVFGKQRRRVSTVSPLAGHDHPGRAARLLAAAARKGLRALPDHVKTMTRRVISTTHCLLPTVFFAALLAAGLAAHAQTNRLALAEEYTVRRWGVEDGLPEGMITSLQQFPDGFLWLTTPRHVVRFDGVEFVTFSGDVCSVDKIGKLNGILRDRQGNVWVSGETGVIRYDGVTWTTVALVGEGHLAAPRFLVFWLRETADGALWLASSEGLFKYDGHEFRLIPPVGGTKEVYYSAAIVDPPLIQGTNAPAKIWLLGGSGLFSFDGQNYTQPDSSGIMTNRMTQLFTGSGGAFWATDAKGNLSSCSHGGWTSVMPRTLRVSALLEREDGTLWLGVVEGLYRWNGKRMKVVTGPDFEMLHSVRCLAFDSRGDGLWVGTGNGLVRLGSAAIRMFPILDRDQAKAVTAIQPFGTNAFWVGVANAGLWSGPVANLAPSANVPKKFSRKAFVTALLQSGDGALWIGTQGVHLWRMPTRGEGYQLTSPPGVASRDITSLLEDSSGRIWVGTPEGLYTREEGDWLVRHAGGPEDAVLSLCNDGAGGLWAGTQSCGLWHRSEKGNWMVLRTSEGMPSDTIRGLIRDGSARLWVATPKGVALVEGDGQRIVSFARDQGLPDDDIRQILDDTEGQLWVGTRRAILRVSKADFLSVAEKSRAVLTPQLFGSGHGLKGELSGGDNSGSGPLAVRTAEGRLWFAMRSGLAMLDPGLLTDEAPPPLYIEGVWAMSGPGVRSESLFMPQTYSDTVQSGPSPARFPAGSRNIAIRYTSPCFSAPEYVMFRTKLEGYETDWSKPAIARGSMYSKLPPGAYRFRVMAFSSAGGWREAGDGVSFVVMPFFWQTWWFLSLSGALMLGSVGLASGWLVRRRARRKLERLERERAMDRERTRIARDIHDEVGANLTHISILGTLAARDDVPDTVSRAKCLEVAEVARETIRACSEIVWSVNPMNDSLKNFVLHVARYAGEYLAPARIRCRTEAAESLPEVTLAPACRHELFLVVKEALQNVVKHAQAKEVRLTVAVREGMLEVRVADDGVGFNPALIVAEAGSPHGNGLGNMQARMASVQGRCSIESGWGGKGTTVVLAMPLFSGGRKS